MTFFAALLRRRLRDVVRGPFFLAIVGLSFVLQVTPALAFLDDDVDLVVRFIFRAFLFLGLDFVAAVLVFALTAAATTAASAAAADASFCSAVNERVEKNPTTSPRERV